MTKHSFSAALFASLFALFAAGFAPSNSLASITIAPEFAGRNIARYGLDAICTSKRFIEWSNNFDAPCVSSGNISMISSPVSESSNAQLLLLGFALICGSRRRFDGKIFQVPRNLIVAIIAILFTSFMTPSLRGSVLTFDQFIDPAKTTRIANNLPANQFYGDNITDFSPAAPVGGQYVNYGSGGGLTPNVKVAYRWYDTQQPTNPNPNNNGPGGVFGWNTQYGGLLYVIFSDPDTLDRMRWLSEVQFTPDPGFQVVLNSFDYAGFQTATPGQTLKIVADANSANPQLLWSAGADGAVSFPATAATLTPNVVGAPGQTLSILWGFSDGSGLDNINFSQLAVPELASFTVWLGLMCCGLARRR